MQTKKIYDFPVVVMGGKYWRELGTFLDKAMLELGTIDEHDLDFIKMTDDLQEAFDIIHSPRPRGLI